MVCRTFTVSLIVASTNILQYSLCSPCCPQTPQHPRLSPPSLRVSFEYYVEGFALVLEACLRGFHALIAAYHPLCHNASASLRHPGWKLLEVLSSFLEVKWPTKGCGLQGASRRIRSTGTEVGGCYCACTSVLVPRASVPWLLSSFPSNSQLFPKWFVSLGPSSLGDCAAPYSYRRSGRLLFPSGFYLPLGS